MLITSSIDPPVTTATPTCRRRNASSRSPITALEPAGADVDMAIDWDMQRLHEFRTGVPDINGSRIQAREIEVVGQGADPFPGWARYENAEYGIVLRLPGGWSLEESAGEVAPTGPVAPAVVATKDGYRLVIQFARPDEELVLGPSGRGAGSIAEGGEALLLGNRVPTHYLVYEGKIKSMFLGDRFADLEFYIQLDPEPGPGTPAYEDLELPPDVLAEVSRILASISIK